MSACETLTANASAGVAPALRAVDCLASETTSAAFGRLFGSNGALLPALTILLTLYIGFFAFSLLTGRSRIIISALSPRMVTLGLVLTFATSWIAYQSVVWNLAVGAPDQIAGILTGAQGSATQMFADRIDIVFAAIAEVGSQNSSTAQGAAASAGTFTPPNLMWLSALLLMLGTVGVLVTSRIALAVLLALGPIFVVFAIFNGTRSLFVGWLRGVVMTGITPLFTVLGGSFMLELAVPVISALRGADGMIDGRSAMALFLIASVHVALMVMVLKVCGTIVGNWQVFGLAPDRQSDPVVAAVNNLATATATHTHADAAPASRSAQPGRAAAVMPAAAAPMSLSEAPAQAAATNSRRTLIERDSARASSLPPLPQQRARGVGSRFRSSPTSSRRLMK